MSRASLKILVDASILTGGNRTKAIDVRALMYALIDEVLNIPDDITSVAGVTAFVGGGQTNAVLLTEKVSRVDTCTVDFGSVKFAESLENTKKTILNASAKKVNLFPKVGERFRYRGVLLAVDQEITIAPKNQITVYCFKNEPGIYTTI